MDECYLMDETIPSIEDDQRPPPGRTIVDGVEKERRIREGISVFICNC